MPAHEAMHKNEKNRRCQECGLFMKRPYEHPDYIDGICPGSPAGFSVDEDEDIGLSKPKEKTLEIDA